MRPHTRGMAYESDLQDNLVKGNELDKGLLALESKYLKDTVLTKYDMQTGASTAEKLQALVKANNKIMMVMRTCMKASTSPVDAQPSQPR